VNGAGPNAKRSGGLETTFPDQVILLDHIVGKREQSVRIDEAKCLGSLEVKHKFDLGGPNDRQVARLNAGKYATERKGQLDNRPRAATRCNS
jgi:hypothetical protein